MAIAGRRKIKPKKIKRGKKKKGVSAKVNVFLAMLFMLGIVFLPSAVIIVVGLLPMVAAFFTDRGKKKTKTVTVGAMNLAGVAPFLMELWTTDPTMEKAVSILFDPMAIIVMYSAAGVGYIIDWALTLLIASFLYQRGGARKKAIEKRQEELVARWGKEVTGKIALDEDGFPIEGMAEKKA